MGKQKVKFVRRCWDADFFHDLMYGNGFLISEPDEVNIDGRPQKAMFGVRSPLYGTTYEDEKSFIERTRCKCGAFTGKLFEGETCPICHTKVEFKDSDINVTGWISLGENRVISPYYFNLISQTIGSTKKPVLTDILNIKQKVNVDGNIVNIKEGDTDFKPLSPYSGKGIDYFYNHFEEIMTYFTTVKKAKKDVIDTIIKQKANVFVSHIPIPSTLLRPQSSTSDAFYYISVEKTINTLYNLSTQIKNAVEIERGIILWRIQTKVNTMWNIYFEELNGKEGFIKDDMLGGSLNYTARNVITPDPTLHDNEIDLSYHTFRELFKYKIIRALMVTRGINLSDAYHIWRLSSNFDESVYNIMMMIIETEDTSVLINRNPTLNYYSMLLMKVRKVLHSGTDYCLAVPLSVLPGLNADFNIIIGVHSIVICY